MKEKLCISPIYRDDLDGLTTMDSALLRTVTEHIACLFPSLDDTRTVHFPAAIAVTIPVSSTEATLGLLLVQITEGSVAFVGATVAVKVSVSPTVRVNSPRSRDTPVTFMASVVKTT